MARKTRLPASSLPVVAHSDDEVHFLAQALDYYRAVQRAGKEAPFGQFLNDADAAVTEKGRELLRQLLENIVETEIDEIEKKTRLDSVRSARRHVNTSVTALKPSEPRTVSSSPTAVTKNATLADCRNLLPMRPSDWKKTTPLAFGSLPSEQVRKAPTKMPKKI